MRVRMRDDCDHVKAPCERGMGNVGVAGGTMLSEMMSSLLSAVIETPPACQPVPLHVGAILQLAVPALGENAQTRQYLQLRTR